MGRYAITRLVQLVFSVWGIVTVVFILLRLSGDPVALFINDQSTPEQIAVIRQELGVDQPIPIQYARFLGQAAIGDFGTSLRQGRPALEVVFERLGATAELAAAALALTILIGVPTGVIAAAKRGSLIDRLTMLSAVFGQGIPTFLLGLLLIWVFAVDLRWLPVGQRGGIEHLILPAITVAAYGVARIARLTRSAVLEVLGEDFVRTARAKGLGEQAVLWRHALRNAWIPVVTAIGFTFAGFIGGAVITETIFAWPGIGRLLVQAVSQRDYPVVQAAVVITALAVAIANLLTDLAYGVLDPRIRIFR